MFNILHLQTLSTLKITPWPGRLFERRIFFSELIRKGGPLTIRTSTKLSKKIGSPWPQQTFNTLIDNINGFGAEHSCRSDWDPLASRQTEFLHPRKFTVVGRKGVELHFFCSTHPINRSWGHSGRYGFHLEPFPSILCPCFGLVILSGHLQTP